LQEQILGALPENRRERFLEELEVIAGSCAKIAGKDGA
jgi:hypothetical protein